MGDFDLRPPSLGDSLPRARTPHLVEPEELRLRGPGPAPRGYTPPGRPSVDPADVMRAVGHYAEETPAPGPRRTTMAPAPTVRPRTPDVRLGSDVRGEGDTREGVVTADVGHPELRAHGEVGLEGRRDESGTSTASGTARASIDAERSDRALHVEGSGTRLGSPDDATAAVEARVRAGTEHGSHVEIDGGAEHRRGETRGHAGVRARVGSERGPHVDAAVDTAELGSRHPRVMASTGLAAGVGLPRLDLEAGRTGGDDDTLRAGGSVSIAPRDGTSLRLGGAAVGLETDRPTGSLELEARHRLAPGIDLHGILGADGFGGRTSGRGSLGVEAEVMHGVHVGAELNAAGVGTRDVSGGGEATFRLDLP